jgi:hypothetical protein
MIKFICDFGGSGRWLSPGTPVSSTNKTDRNDTTEILLKVALNTITLTLTPSLIVSKSSGPIIVR